MGGMISGTGKQFVAACNMSCAMHDYQGVFLMKLARAVLYTAVFAATAASMTAAHADPRWNRGERYRYEYDDDDRGRDRHEYEERHEHGHRHGRDRVVIVDEDRGYIREYISRDYHSHCPPGLAKKHNGCVPPGHARHYVIGRPLDDEVVYEEVPEPLLVRLRPVPRGYRYVMVDHDVLLMSEASKEIIDAVTLLSAVGH